MQQIDITYFRVYDSYSTTYVPLAKFMYESGAQEFILNHKDISVLSIEWESLSFQIYENYKDYLDQTKKNALAKLTKEERIALGLGE
jgi:hypothetical protein